MPNSPAASAASEPALAEAARNLRLRTASALVLAPIAIVAIWLGGWSFCALAIVFGAGLTFEWGQLCTRSHRAFSLASGTGIIWAAAAALIWLRARAYGLGNVLFLLSLVWSTDIGAYLVGRTFGGPRLAPRISPGKTWAGAIGGVVFAACAGIAAAAVGGTGAPRAVAIAAGLSIIAQAGDLAESAAKRRFGVKDSGRLIPGHGGLLDRLDSTLAVALAGALLAFLRGAGVVLWK